MTSTILVADDEPAITLCLQLALSRAGYRVLVAADGDEAITITRREHPDLLLLDIMMPGQDGFSVMETLRGEAATARLPIIVISGRTRPIDLEKGLALGADDYLCKPFTIATLLERVAARLPTLVEIHHG